MAFKDRNMSVLACANGFTLWHYKADEPIEHVLGRHFFAPVRESPLGELLHNGDVIYISDGCDTYIRTIKIRLDGIYLYETK